jgi:hypothetical protein
MSWREMIISREKVIQAPAAPVGYIPLPRLEPPKLTPQRRDPGDGLWVLTSSDVTTYFFPYLLRRLSLQMHNLPRRKQVPCLRHNSNIGTLFRPRRCSLFHCYYDHPALHNIHESVWQDCSHNLSQSVIDQASRTLHLLLKEKKREEMLLREEI